MLGSVVWVTAGLLQMFAIYDALEDWYGLPWMLAVPAALWLGYLPPLGTVLGLIAAVQIWHWKWLSSAVIFSPGIFVLVVALFKQRVNWNTTSNA